MKKGPAILLGVVIGIYLTLAPSSVDAASLYIDPHSSYLYRGDSVTLSVRLDVDETAQECINAVDAVITYSTNIEPVDVSVGDSIFNVWVEPPTINRDDRTITFAGGIPNGYCGRVAGDPRLTNTLAKIVIQLPGFSIGGGDSDTGTVSFSDETTAYLNDGLGTKVVPATYGAEIQLDKRAGATMQSPWNDEVEADSVPPEEFSIALEKSDTAFSQKWFIVFSTTDKQTGVDHYEVMEEPIELFGSFQWGRADAPWIEARSPYVLKDQSLNSTIYVKAIDKAGNEYIAKLDPPDKSMRSLSSGQLTTIMVTGFVLLVLLMIVIFLIVSLKRRRRRATVTEREVPAAPDVDNPEQV